MLQTAVRDPDIASLSILADVPDPVEWLQDNLDVEFPQQGEILSISLTDDAPAEDLVALVNAVAKAYEDEVVFVDQQRRLGTRDLLAKSLEEAAGRDPARKWEDLPGNRSRRRPSSSDGARHQVPTC